jgi:predicted metal-dependent hydrolase
MKKDSLQYSLTHDNLEIHFSVIRSKRKSVGIVVSPDRSIQVRAPRYVSKSSILEIVNSKAGWIARKMAEVEQCQPLPTPRNYASGEKLLYLGRHYRLIVLSGKPQPAALTGEYLYVWASPKDDAAQIRQSVKEWYQKQAQETLGQYLDKCLIVAMRHEIPKPTHTTVRDMKTRWGSCSPKGRVTLNVKLVQVPVHCLEYVVMHELCHLRHHDHGKSFYSLLTRCMPDWQGRKEALDRFCLVE